MPTRILREGIISSESVNSISERAELFYRKLMSVVDDYGRYYANPISLLGACYPLRPTVCEADVKQMLSECIAAKLLVIYGGGKFLLLLNFKQQTRSKSKFPEPTENELLSKCTSNDKQICRVVGVEDVGVGEGVRVIISLREKMNKLYRRDANVRWEYAEESQLVEIAKRPGVAAEADRIILYQRKLPYEDRKYFPNSVYSLLNKWSEVLDKINFCKPQVATPTPEPRLTGAVISDEFRLKAAAELASLKSQINKNGHTGSTDFET
jgi:hypothetical protein